VPKVSFIEKTVRDIEGFQIKITWNGVDVRGDKILPKQYPARRMSRNSFTVGDWRKKFQSYFPGFDVEVLDPYGNSFRRNTKLRTVRGTYLDCA